VQQRAVDSVLNPTIDPDNDPTTINSIIVPSVSVVGPNGGPFTIVINGALAGVPPVQGLQNAAGFPTLGATSSPVLTPDAITATTTVAPNPISATVLPTPVTPLINTEVQRLVFNGNPTAGTFRLGFGNTSLTSGPITFSRSDTVTSAFQTASTVCRAGTLSSIATENVIQTLTLGVRAQEIRSRRFDGVLGSVATQLPGRLTPRRRQSAPEQHPGIEYPGGVVGATMPVHHHLYEPTAVNVSLLTTLITGGAPTATVIATSAEFTISFIRDLTNANLPQLTILTPAFTPVAASVAPSTIFDGLATVQTRRSTRASTARSAAA
jgi:hypothetical protein